MNFSIHKPLFGNPRAAMLALATRHEKHELAKPAYLVLKDEPSHMAVADHMVYQLDNPPVGFTSQQYAHGLAQFAKLAASTADFIPADLHSEAHDFVDSFAA